MNTIYRNSFLIKALDGTLFQTENTLSNEFEGFLSAVNRLVDGNNDFLDTDRILSDLHFLLEQALARGKKERTRISAPTGIL